MTDETSLYRFPKESLHFHFQSQASPRASPPDPSFLRQPLHQQARRFPRRVRIRVNFLCQ
uniref:Pentatricopeptide repeat-containing protein At2g29760ic-like n=1 Tax=Rhizophora mucronata TaxID=61149 RepID=A0A2P2IK41_RHIMU